MKLAILSDIHSNCFALEAVLEELHAERPDRVLFLGDLFGYYPWAVQTYVLLQEFDPLAVKGNHDVFVTQEEPPAPQPPYWNACKANERELKSAAPDALRWLGSIPTQRVLETDELAIHLCHGTPDDNLSGRYYPDDERVYGWFPDSGDVLLLGHSHYPFEKHLAAGGLVANPGAVGQPRDGDIRASWAVLETHPLTFRVKRTAYDVSRAVERLNALDWDRRAIVALQKDYSGPLQIV